MTDHIDTAQEREKLADLAGHTPGPWRCSRPDMASFDATTGQQVSFLYVDDERMEFATAAPVEDARLAARAPDLLALANRLLDALDAERAKTARLRRNNETLHRTIETMLEAGAIVVSRAEKAEAKRDETERHLGEILANIHSDGGHYQSDHGTAKAVADAHEKITQMRVEIDKAEAALQRVVDATWNEAVEACAAVVDRANRTGPYQAIGAAAEIRALKRPEASHE